MTPYQCPDATRELWHPGDHAWYEYRCWESPESHHADLWYRSHQRVTVLHEDESDAWEGSTFEERADAGQPRVYLVRFEDGHEGYATEDELLTTRDAFERPDPPPNP